MNETNYNDILNSFASKSFSDIQSLFVNWVRSIQIKWKWNYLNLKIKWYVSYKDRYIFTSLHKEQHESWDDKYIEYYNEDTLEITLNLFLE